MKCARHVLVGLLAVAFSAVLLAQSDSFDKPVRRVVVRLGRSPELMPHNNEQVELTCDYYPTLMVKELDDPGMKGTRWVTVTHISKGQYPPCRKAHSSSEDLLRSEGDFFLGIKEHFLFLEAPDGLDSGMQFHVLDDLTHEHEVFRDTALFWEGGKWIPLLSFGQAADGKLRIRYRRVVEGDCSIPKDGIACWNKLKARYGLGDAPIPKCLYYAEAGKRNDVDTELGYPPVDISVQSALAYPVEVTLSGRPTIKVLTGQIRCTPED